MVINRYSPFIDAAIVIVFVCLGLPLLKTKDNTHPNERLTRKPFCNQIYCFIPG